MHHESNLLDVIIKKDFFVKSRKDNIKDEFDFLSVNFLFYLVRFLEKEPMELCTKPKKNNIQISFGLLKLSKRKVSRINKH
mgnify:CR=1 FL=1